MRRLVLSSAVLTLFLNTPGPGRAEWIDTTSSWDGRAFVWPFGQTGTPTYGQTFTATASANVLTGFSFYMQHRSGGPVNFAAYVMRWDGTGATGPILYQSEKQTLLTTDTGFRQFSFTMNTPLVVGKQYVAFLSTSSFFDGTTGQANMGFTASNPYPAGTFAFSNNRSTSILGVTSTWDGIGYPNRGNSEDAAFKATFSAASPATVPEPGSLTLLGLGALGVAGHAWRKRRLAAGLNG